jgi:AraC family transcriptional regulator
MTEHLTSTPISERVGYVARCNGVVDYIDAHLDGPLDLHTLAAVAHFSPWHFHRLFHAMMGETLSERVRRRRLEAAARLLLATPPGPVQAIALDTGFCSAEVFTRTFKAHFGVTPSAWRQGAHQSWTSERRLQLRKIHQGLRKPDHAGERPSTEDDPHRLTGSRSKGQAASMKVEIKKLPTLRVAYMRHVGPYGDPRIGRLWERFMRWANHNNLPDGKRLFIGVSHDSPDIAMPDKCRYDTCAEVDPTFTPRRDVGVQDIRGGLYGCARFDGSSADIYDAWLRLYGEWLPASGYQPDDRLCIEVYGNDVVVDAATGRFTCALCLPVRPL